MLQFESTCLSKLNTEENKTCNYPSMSRWRKAIDSGAEKGYWEHVSGSGITGSVHLLMDDFNPACKKSL